MYTPINLNAKSIKAAFQPIYYQLLCKLTLLFNKMQPEMGKEIPPKIKHSLGLVGVSSYLLPSLLRTHACSQQRGSPASPLPSPHTLPSASSPPFLSSVSRYYREASKAPEMLGEDGGRRRSTFVGRSESRQTVNSSDAMTTWQPGSRQAARRAFQEYACDIFKNKKKHTHRHTQDASTDTHFTDFPGKGRCC